ncbi:MAG: 4-hydroxy-3-methylbut-2-enyl diphosphate reductase [Coriobacteriia bacterium]|nr:4-hydroxy-3-methylbut-2-enyl diphosphate reductase [Coriobacteriia bacterium]
MEVKVARYAGVCYGVERALKLAEQAATQSGAVHSFGPLIHNPQAVSALERRGVQVAATLDEVVDGTLIIRSHGVIPDVITDATARGLEVVDATCPHVSKAQESAKTLAAEGYFVIIVGEADHPEVSAIRAHAGEHVLVVQSADELPPRLGTRTVGVVVQTTQMIDVLEEVVAALLPRVSELRVCNTICDATAKRQVAADDLAEEVDVVVVVGGHNSGNTTRLAQICSAVNERTYHVETPEELDPAWFAGAETVGVTAGASTPGAQMAGVVARIEEMSPASPQERCAHEAESR